MDEQEKTPDQVEHAKALQVEASDDRVRQAEEETRAEELRKYRESLPDEPPAEQ